MIKHIFKDGTTTTESSDARVPQEMVERIHGIVRKGKEDETKETVQNQEG